MRGKVVSVKKVAVAEWEEARQEGFTELLFLQTTNEWKMCKTYQILRFYYNVFF